MKFTPRPYQDLGIDHLLANLRSALFAGCGMGKTVTTLTALDIASLSEDIYPVLAVGPKRVASTVWGEESIKWDHLKNVQVAAIMGKTFERERALRSDANVFTVNYENVPWLIDRMNGTWPFKTVIADESTRLKGFRLKQGGARAQALGKVAHVTPHWINLTGTPVPNGLIDLWGQNWFIDKGQRLGSSFTAFKERWFTPERVGDNAFAVRWNPLPFAQDQIQDLLRDVCLTLDPHDYFDLREPIHTVVRCAMPDKARKQYEEMEKELFFQIKQGSLFDIEAGGAADKSLKCLQIANGAIYLDEKRSEWARLHDAKLEALESIVMEAAGASVLVAYQFKHDLERLKHAFPKGEDLSDDKSLRRFKKGEIQIGFAHPASLGHGVDGLQNVCNMIAFFGHWWSLEERHQMIERIGPVRQLQAGFDRAVFVYDIIAHDTIDELVMLRHQTKRSVQDIFLDALKRRGL